jgi:hypothetical protein
LLSNGNAFDGRTERREESRRRSKDAEESRGKSEELAEQRRAAAEFNLVPGRATWSHA